MFDVIYNNFHYYTDTKVDDFHHPCLVKNA